MPLCTKVAILYNSLNYHRREGGIPIAEREVIDEAKAVEEALSKMQIAHLTVVVGESIRDWLEELFEYKPDVVFNLCEAVRGESRLEMNVPCVLELMRIPYTGSPPLTLGICQNKALTKDMLLLNGIFTPKYYVITEALGTIGKPMPFPVIVKPLREDGSLGINSNSVARNQFELTTLAQNVISTYHQPAIVEQYVDGRELNVAILGDSPPQPLPISEIVFSGSDEFEIVSYEAKWVKDSEAYRSTIPVCPAHLDSDIASKVLDTALKAYKILGCRDYARIDIRLRKNTPYVLEVNPNPDITPDSGFIRSLNAAGIKYVDFIKKLLSFSVQRGRKLDTSTI
ncbi:MAG: ATP-grasp domain-containing protein [Nitrososphaerales archaeon]|nr:ATP-grasp domain-containing protein [Nitrososphaerales archaeon]